MFPTFVLVPPKISKCQLVTTMLGFKDNNWAGSRLSAWSGAGSTDTLWIWGGYQFWYFNFFPYLWILGGYQFWYFNFFPYLWILGGYQLKKTPCILNHKLAGGRYFVGWLQQTNISFHKYSRPQMMCKSEYLSRTEYLLVNKDFFEASSASHLSCATSMYYSWKIRSLLSYPRQNVQTRRRHGWFSPAENWITFTNGKYILAEGQDPTCLCGLEDQFASKRTGVELWGVVW